MIRVYSRIGSSLALSGASFALAGLLLHDVLVNSVDDGHGEEDTSSGSDGSQEIGEDGEETGEHTTQKSSSLNQLLQLLVGSVVGVALKTHSLVLEVIADLSGSLSGNTDPGLTEEGAT